MSHTICRYNSILPSRTWSTARTIRGSSTPIANPLSRYISIIALMISSAMQHVMCIGAVSADYED